MPTLTQLSSNLTEIVIYAAIALVTLTGLCKCIYPLLRNASLLNRAVIKLEKSTAAGERPIWREARFLGRSLRNEWQQFLLNAGQLDMRGIPCDTREYINEETVVEKPGHAQLAELIPGLLDLVGYSGHVYRPDAGPHQRGFQQRRGDHPEHSPAAQRHALCLCHLSGGHFLLAFVQHVQPHVRGPRGARAGQF